MKLSGMNIVFFTVYGILVSVVFYYLAPFICHILDNPNAVYSVKAIAPCLFFCCLGSAIKGYFEGTQRMTPTAVTQLCEVTIKVCAGLYFAKWIIETVLGEFFSYKTVFGITTTNLQDALDRIVPVASAYSIHGITLAALISTVFIYILYIKQCGIKGLRINLGYFRQTLSIVKFSLPIAVSAFIINLYPMIDMCTIIKGLKFVIKDSDEAIKMFPFLIHNPMDINELCNFLYGCYSGIAMTIFHLVPAVTASLAAASLPLISSLHAKENSVKTGETADAVMRFSAIFCFPTGLGMYFMAEPILSFLFKTSPLEVSVAVPMLKVLGIAAIFVGLSAPAFSLLQGMGKPMVPTWFLGIFLILKALLNFLLNFNKHINVYASPIATLICYFFISLLCVRNISNMLPKKISMLKISLKPLMFSLIACPAARKLYLSQFGRVDNFLNLLISIGFSAIIYLLLMVVTGEFKQEYIKLLYHDKNNQKHLKTSDF